MSKRKFRSLYEEICREEALILSLFLLFHLIVRGVLLRLIVHGVVTTRVAVYVVIADAVCRSQDDLREHVVTASKTRGNKARVTDLDPDTARCHTHIHRQEVVVSDNTTGRELCIRKARRQEDIRSTFVFFGTHEHVNAQVCASGQAHTLRQVVMTLVHAQDNIDEV